MNRSMWCMHLVLAVFKESGKSLLQPKIAGFEMKGRLAWGNTPPHPPTKKTQIPKQTKKPKLNIVLENVVYPA